MQFVVNRWGVVAGLSGFTAVVMGAVGAHAVADAHLASLVEAASLYELVHAGVLLWLCGARGKYAMAARGLLLIGTVLFCGTLYLKAHGMGDGRQAGPDRGRVFHARVVVDCARGLDQQRPRRHCALIRREAGIQT